MSPAKIVMFISGFAVGTTTMHDKALIVALTATIEPK
jgi:hypothetical protein